jgi:hypothetical protein
MGIATRTFSYAVGGIQIGESCVLRITSWHSKGRSQPVGGNVDSTLFVVVSDSVDCDPCQAYRFQGCEACTSAPEGCLWCPSDAICKSIGTTMPVDTKFSCADSDFISTCEPSTTAFFADSFYGSMEYLYDMVRVKPVWEAGYSTYHSA